MFRNRSAFNSRSSSAIGNKLLAELVVSLHKPGCGEQKLG